MKLLSLLLLLLLTTPCLGKPGPLVVILLPGTSLHDWQTADAPCLHRLMDSGSLAVMNTRTARQSGDKQRESPESALLTLGAGARAASVATKAIGYHVLSGNLTEALEKAHVVIRTGGGNNALLVAASQSREIQTAASLSTLAPGCTIWDAGSDIRAADTLIGHAARLVDTQNGRLIVLAAFANNADYAVGRRLSPVLEYGETVPAGLLVSASTRRPGLVTNTDFAPTVAGYFGLSRADFPARPFGVAWTFQATHTAAAQTTALAEQAYRQGRGMRILPYSALALAAWILLATLLLIRGKLPVWAAAIPLTATLALLLARSAAEACAYFLLLTLLGFGVAARCGWRIVPSILASGIIFVLVGTLAMGGSLMHSSLLGYSAVEGARYYGIGNEAMGLLVGSTLVVAARLWPLGKYSKACTLALLIGVTILMGLPQAGAKAGGLLVASSAFGIFLWEKHGAKWSWRTIAIVGMASIGLLGIVALGDSLSQQSHQSHMGEAIQRIRSGGFGEASGIIARKLAVEGRLAWHSTWAALLWIGVLSLRQTRPISKAGFVAVAACFLFNDAGTVAAALCLVPLWSDAALQSQKGLGRTYFLPRPL